MANAPTHTATAHAAHDAGARFWDHVDGLLSATRAFGTQALASMKRAGALVRGAAPPPPRRVERRNARTRAAVEGLGSFLVDLHVEEIKQATDTFLRAVVEVAKAVEDAETAREARCLEAHAALVAAFGDELVGEALAHAPTARRTVERMGKRRALGPASLARALRLVGDDWTRDPYAGPGKLVVSGGVYELVVDVAFASFRVRDRASGAWCDAGGALVDVLDVDDAAAFFARTHFTVAP